MKHVKHIFFTLCILGGISHGAFYQEDFEGFTAGPVDGQDGWAGNTAVDTAPGTVIAGSIAGFGGAQILELGPSSDWNGRDITLPNQTVYYGFSLRIANRTGGGTANETFFRIGGWDTFVQVDAFNDEIEARINNTATTFPSIGLVEGDEYRIVGKLNWNGSAFDNHSIFLNPVGLEGANTAVAFHADTTTVAGATRLTVRNDDTASAIDDIVFSTSWGSAVPEPGTLGLLGLGALFALWSRRRRS